MKRIRTIITTLIIVLSIFAFSTIKTDAATGTISISSNKSKVVVGDQVKFTVTVSSTKYMAALQYDITYSDSLSLTSGNKSDAPVFSGNGVKNKTYTFTFKAKKSGTASMTFNAVGATMVGDEEVKFTSKSKSVKIITEAELEASYSKNNNLSKLSVEGYSLSPSFSSSITSYTVNLPANTESIKINCTKADATASIGNNNCSTKTVEDGSNTFKIIVTAQNGSTKTYTINAIVEELDPINVTLEDKEYTVVRKAKLLEAPSTDFVNSTTKINEHEVPTLFNEKANITLIGLKDSEGNIKLFIYDNDTYTKYNQYTFEKVTLHILNKEIENYEKTEEIDITNTNIISIPKDENTIITTYILKNDKYYYFYAINLENGKENIYRFDKEENTIQRHEFVKNDDVVKKDETNNNTYQTIIIGLLAFIFLTYLIILISLLLKGNKKKNKKENKELEVVQIKEEELSVEEQEIHEEIERIGTQELQLRDLKKQKDGKVSSLEKEKYKKDAEEELNRIKEENVKDNSEVNEVINELFENEIEKDEEERKIKSKGTKKKKNKKD